MNNIPKGTKDVLPAESWQWQYLEQTARAVTEAYRFEEIRTPTFEHTEVFLRGIGDTTDVVNKEMYTFEDKGGRSVTLKPEGTAGVARSFVENLSGQRAARQAVLYHALFPLRAAAGGAAEGIPPVRGGVLRLARTVRGRGGHSARPRVSEPPGREGAEAESQFHRL